MSYFHELREALIDFDIESLAHLRGFVRATEGTLWVCGNGGSAATALHWACDLSKAGGLRAQALGANLATLTAWSNDAGYEGALAGELERIGRSGDRLICLSCSGTSLNIVTVLRQAWLMKMPRALITGVVNLNTTPVDVQIQVRSSDYAVIEDVHSAIGHWLTKGLAR